MFLADATEFEGNDAHKALCKELFNEDYDALVTVKGVVLAAFNITDGNLKAFCDYMNMEGKKVPVQYHDNDANMGKEECELVLGAYAYYCTLKAVGKLKANQQIKVSDARKAFNKNKYERKDENQ